MPLTILEVGERRHRPDDEAGRGDEVRMVRGRLARAALRRIELNAEAVGNLHGAQIASAGSDGELATRVVMQDEGHALATVVLGAKIEVKSHRERVSEVDPL